MIDFLSFIAGLVALVVIRWVCVKRIIEAATSKPLEADAPTEEAAKWVDIVTYRSNGGWYIGFFESVLFYSAFVLADTSVQFIIAGYLAFKVACKWEVWSHVYRVPNAIRGVDPVKYLHFRVRWGAYLFDRFIVGTLLSLLTAGVAAVVEHYSRQWIVDLSVRGFGG